jgi:hypothetical protein
MSGRKQAVLKDLPLNLKCAARWRCVARGFGTNKRQMKVKEMNFPCKVRMHWRRATPSCSGNCTFSTLPHTNSFRFLYEISATLQFTANTARFELWTDVSSAMFGKVYRPSSGTFYLHNGRIFPTKELRAEKGGLIP